MTGEYGICALAGPANRQVRLLGDALFTAHISTRRTLSPPPPLPDKCLNPPVCLKPGLQIIYHHIHLIQGRIAADNIAGRDSRFRGCQGTSVVGLFGLTVASTGEGSWLIEAWLPGACY